jgi:hypothetical protein
VEQILQEGFSRPPTSPGVNPYFLCGYFKDRAFQKNPHIISEARTATQSKIEVISTETLTKTLNNFVLPVQTLHDHRGHYVEFTYCNKRIFQVWTMYGNFIQFCLMTKKLYNFK